MQSNIADVFGKVKRRKAAVENEATHLFPNQTARNSKPAKSRLFSILKEADIDKKKRQKPNPPSNAPAATQPRATTNDRAPMEGHNFAHRSAGRPKPISQNTRSQPSQYITQNEQQSRRPDVRDFKRANRLAGLFSSTAERSVQAEAAWKASESARRFATARLKKGNIQEKTERAAKLAEERERVSKEQAEKKAVLREEELSRKERRRVAAINAQNEQFRKAAAEREAGFVPDSMWPRENWQGVVFGDNYRAYKRSQQKEANQGLNWDERLERAFDEDTPKATIHPLEEFLKKYADKNKTARKESRRNFDENDPDDCWGYGSAPRSMQEDCSGWEWAESPPSDYSSGYGSPSPSSSRATYDWNEETFRGNDGARGEDGMGYDDDDDDDSNGYGYFQGAEWENFKRCWHEHSRHHHHDYYTHAGDAGTGDAGGSGRGGAGVGARRQTTVPLGVCQQSAARAAQRAVDAARNGASTIVQDTNNRQEGNGQSNDENFADINTRMEEIKTAVSLVAQHSGNDMIAFASALKIHIDYSHGQEHARKMAKKGLLMTLHPDKLARAGALEQYLGQCVTQLINTSVK